MIFDFLIDAQFKYRTFDIFQTFLSLNRELEYTENRCESSLTRTGGCVERQDLVKYGNGKDTANEKKFQIFELFLNEFDLL